MLREPRLTPFASAVVLTVCLFVALGHPSVVHGQARWLQTVQIIVPVDDDHVTGVLLDTLATVIQREDLPVRRAPDEEATQPYASLEAELLDAGLDVYSATHAFVSFRYEGNDRGFSSTITDVHFIYRPAQAGEADMPILYVDLRDTPIRHALANSGTPIRENEAALQPFNEQLMLSKLDEAVVVRVGNRVIRDSTAARAEKQRLLATIRQWLY